MVNDLSAVQIYWVQNYWVLLESTSQCQEQLGTILKLNKESLKQEHVIHTIWHLYDLKNTEHKKIPTCRDKHHKQIRKSAIQDILLKAGGTHITSCLWFCTLQHHINIHTIFDTCPVWPEKYWTEESKETKLQTAKRSKQEKEHLMNSMPSKRTEHHINLWCCELFMETIHIF